MRKSLASLIALAVLGLAMPMATSSPADAKHYGGHKKVVVVKTHRDRGLHRGWYKGRHYGWYTGRHYGKSHLIVR